MSKRQTRSSISYRAEVFERARKHAEASGMTMTAYAEQALVAALDRDGAPMLERADAVRERTDRRARKATTKPTVDVEPEIRQHFTF